MAGAVSSAKASTAGSSSRACGASIQTRRSSKIAPRSGAASAGLAQPHHDIDARDLIALRRMRQSVEHHLGVRDVDQRVLAFDEEVMVVGHVGVEISL